MPTYAKIRDEMRAHLMSAKALADTADAEGRDFTDAERRVVAEHVAKAKELQPRAEAAKANEKARADELWKEKLRGLGPDLPPGSYTGSARAGGGYVAEASSWAKSVAAQLTKTASTFGTKALTTGGLDVPAVVEPTVVLPAVPTSLLDLIPRKGISGNVFSYPRQTVRTNNAAPVADNALKPTSPHTFEEIEDRARVVAHLSEPIPLRFFEDFTELETVLDTQMREELLRVLENQLVGGDGTGENFTGVLNTSGIVTQAWNTTLVDTLRRARTTLANLGETPTAWALNPTDIEAIDLLQDGSGRYVGTEIDHLLGNLPRVPSLAVPQGTAILADWRQSRLYVRQDATLDIDRSGDLFQKNQAVLRVEMRAGLGVLRPQAFCVVDLTA